MKKLLALGIITLAIGVAIAAENAKLSPNGERSLMVVDSSAETKRLVADSRGSVKVALDGNADRAFAYSTQRSTNAFTLSLSGLGLEWKVQAIGGEAAFSINGGSTFSLTSEKYEGSFAGLRASPSIEVSGLTGGATAFVYISASQ